MDIDIKLDILKKMEKTMKEEVQKNEDLDFQIDIYPVCKELEDFCECYMGASICLDGEYINDLETITKKFITFSEEEALNTLKNITNVFLDESREIYNQYFLHLENPIWI